VNGDVNAERILLSIMFAPTAFAQEIKALYDGRFLNAFSIGFIPWDWKPNDQGTRMYTDWELLETSGVTVPSNRLAVMLRQAEAAGMSCKNVKTALHIVDGDEASSGQDEPKERPAELSETDKIKLSIRR